MAELRHHQTEHDPKVTNQRGSHWRCLCHQIGYVYKKTPTANSLSYKTSSHSCCPSNHQSLSALSKMAGLLASPTTPTIMWLQEGDLLRFRPDSSRPRLESTISIQSLNEQQLGINFQSKQTRNTLSFFSSYHSPVVASAESWISSFVRPSSKPRPSVFVIRCFFIFINDWEGIVYTFWRPTMHDDCLATPKREPPEPSSHLSCVVLSPGSSPSSPNTRSHRILAYLMPSYWRSTFTRNFWMLCFTPAQH